MSVEISYRPTRVFFQGKESEGRLILANGRLVAVVVRPGDPSSRGPWHLETELGTLHARNPPRFETVEEAGEWVRTVLSDNADPPAPSEG